MCCCPPGITESFPQLRMCGQRAPLNENDDGEVDEKFWAQAADQAAGRAASDGDEGKTAPHEIWQAYF
jgi:hypothetical protein